MKNRINLSATSLIANTISNFKVKSNQNGFYIILNMIYLRKIERNPNKFSIDFKKLKFSYFYSNV